MLVKKFLALLLAFAFLAAACGSSDDDPEAVADPDPTAVPDADPEPADDPEPEGDDPDPADEPEPQGDPAERATPPPVDPADLFDSAPGVTADTITIGYPVIDFDGLNENFNLGLEYANYNPVIEAWVEEINANGGVNGRMLEVLIEPFIPSEIFAAQAEAVCLKYTEDTQVFAVMEGFNGIPAADDCIVDLHQTIMVGSPVQTQQLERARAPWITDQMRWDRRVRVFTQVMNDEGLLADLGPIYVINPNASYTDVSEEIVAAYEAQGVEVKLNITLENSSDETAVREEMGVILERARTDGVEWIHVTAPMPLASPMIFETNGEFNILASGPQSNASWEYNQPPGMTAGTEIYRLGDGTDKVSFGMDECVRVAEEALGFEVKLPIDIGDDEINWWPGVTNVCNNLALFTQVAAWAGADLNQETFVAAFEEHGSEIFIPGMEFASLGPGKIDARDTVRLEKWDFETTTWVPITDLLDVSDIE